MRRDRKRIRRFELRSMWQPWRVFGRVTVVLLPLGRLWVWATYYGDER